MERDSTNPLPLCQQLRQVGMVDSQIPFPHHGHYPLLHPSRGRVGWVPTSIPVAKGGGALLPIRRQDSPHVSFTHPQDLCRLSHQPPALQHRVQDLQPCLFPRSQRQSFHGLTFSLICYLLTELYNNDTHSRYQQHMPRHAFQNTVS